MIKCKNQNRKTHNILHHKIFMVFAFIFIFTVKMFAQNFEIKGTVSDFQTDEPLPGVNVVVEGTRTGTITDLEGKFRITVPSTKANLQFSFMGYAPQTIPVKESGEINVKLIEDSKSIDEVVAIGYGSARKADLTGAISTISSAAIKDIPVASVAEALTGKISGVQFTSTDGSPDAEVIIRIRGGGSITQNNSPLLLVDGFEVPNINDIPPTDIESIVVLKDASSTAIYGARGANGVILIKTKGAQAGKTTVNLNSFFQVKKFPMERNLDVLSPYEFVLMQYEYAAVRGGTDYDRHVRLYGDFDDIDIYKNVKGTNWQEEMFSKVDPLSKYYNVSVNGGAENTNANLSFTQNDDDGLISTSNYKRSTLNFKLNHLISQNLRLELNSRYSHTLVNGAGTSYGSDLRISDIITARPVNGVADFMDLDAMKGNTDMDEEEYERFISGLIKPTEKVKQDYKRKADQRFDMNAAITWTIIKNLNFRSEFGVGYGFSDNRRYWGPLTGKARNEGNDLPLGQRVNSERKSYRVANTLTYNFGSEIHKFNAMIGQELNNESNSYQDITAYKFPTHITPERMFANFAKGSDVVQRAYLDPDVRMASFFGRINYTFNSKYIFNATLRADGSSKFAPGNQWGYFPAASFAWRLSEEAFMQGIPFISDLKLRASYGQAGNNRISNDMWRYAFGISTNKSYAAGNQINPYYRPTSTNVLPNPDIQWETTITQNLGTDFSFFNDRLYGTIDLYNNQTKDLIVEAPLHPMTGYNRQLVNLGRTSNKGVEVTLNGSIIRTKDFTLSATFNIGINKFRVEALNGEDTEMIISSNWVSAADLKNGDDYRVYVGQDIGLIYGYVSDGFYTVDDFESYDPVTRKYILKEGQPTADIQTGLSLRPGIMKLKDLDNDGKITSEDRQIIGNATAKHFGGFGPTVTYKGFDFNAFFTWKYGFDVYNTNKMLFNTRWRNTNANTMTTVDYANRFKYIDLEGKVITDLEELRALNKDATMWSPFSTASNIMVVNSDAIEDGSFLRLSQVVLGYTLPQNVSSKLMMQKFRLYFTVYNAWLWTKYSGMDPEVSTNRSGSYSALSPGVDYSSYPRSRSYTFGINVIF